MANITLSDIRNAADAKYAHTEIDLEDGTVVTLVNVLRLSKENRAIISNSGEALKAEGADQLEILCDVLRAAARNDGEKLIKAVDGDLAVAMETFTSYMGGTQAGEA